MAGALLYPEFRAFDADGNPLAGGFVYTYAAGTLTPKDTYTTSLLNVTNTNPVELDSEGYPTSGGIWLSGSYKIIIKDANGVQQGDTIDAYSNDPGATGPAGTFPIAAAGGTVDAITADYSPDVTLTNLTTVAFTATGANLTTTPTFAPDGLAAHTITKKGGQPLVPGDIPAAGYVAIVEYNSANTRWEMANPATSSTPWIVATGTADALTATYAPAVPALYDGLILAFRAAAANATTTPTFAPNGLTARTITKKGGTALMIGDIAGNLAEYWVRYNLANTRWELLNPTGVSGITDLTTATIDTAADYIAFFDATDSKPKKCLANSLASTVTAQSTPANPASTTSATQVMMGLAGSITPTGSGKVLIIISGGINNASGNVASTVQIRYGTGAAPSNGAAATGTTAGAARVSSNASGGTASDFSLNAIVSGLTPATAYWIDLGAATASGTLTLNTISISAMEI